MRVLLGAEWTAWQAQPSSSVGQAEFIVAKHRNGGLDNIRMKFIGQLGKFEDLQSNDSPYEFQSKMNVNDAGNPVVDKFPAPDDAFDLPPEDDTPF